MLSQPQVSYLRTPFARHVHLGSFEPFIMEGSAIITVSVLAKGCTYLPFPGLSPLG